MRSILSPLILFILSITPQSFASSEVQPIQDHCNRILEDLHAGDPRYLINPTDDSYVKNHMRGKFIFGKAQLEATHWKAYKTSQTVNENIYKIQLSGIKNLNEDIWNYTGTEGLLEIIYLSTHSYLDSFPSHGRILDTKFKDIFVQTHLNKADFHELIIKPVIKIVDEWLTKRAETSKTLTQLKKSGWSWTNWFNNNLIFDYGPTPELAHFKTRLLMAKNISDPNMSYETWQAQALERRNKLVKITQALHVDWNRVIEALHNYVSRNNGGEQQFTQWFTEQAKTDTTKITPKFVSYLNDLSIGDFFPMPEGKGIFKYSNYPDLIQSRARDPLGAPRGPWQMESRIALENGRNAYYVMLTDVEGLGFQARLAQDQWIAKGAKITELQNIYKPLTNQLNKMSRRIFRGIKRIIGPDKLLIIYQGGGDELSILLPEINANMKLHIEKFMVSINKVSLVGTSFKIHTSPIVHVEEPGKYASLVEANHRANEIMIQSKKRLKK
ncbi:MAG: hypothetical protein SGI74_13590 [Oligoflexia bacterium]|nr:hypothetical protein [Oligoflexia bacterium]